MKNETCVFPGSFDPFTRGHRRLVELALTRFDRVIVAVAEQTYKNETLAAEIRLKIAVKSLADLPNIDVKYFSGMLTDFLAAENCFNVVRGVRNEKDAAYEKELARVYVEMDARVKFVTFVSDLADISAEKVRARLKNGQSPDGLVCPSAADDIIEYYGK